MAIWKRYKSKKLQENDPNWNKGTWIAEGSVAGVRYNQSLRMARTWKEASDMEFEIKSALMKKHGKSHTAAKGTAVKARSARAISNLNYVYIFECNGLYKIGFTNNIHDRIKNIARTIVPYDTFLIMAVQTDEHEKLERELHEEFKAKRVKGEWFNLTPYQLKVAKCLMVENVI